MYPYEIKARKQSNNSVSIRVFMQESSLIIMYPYEY